MTVVEHRFDWYQATVHAPPEAVLRALEAQIPHQMHRAARKGQNSFQHRTDLHDDDGEVFASVQHGGVNPHPNVKSTGEHAPALAAVLRHQFPSHRVSRLDVACDYRGEDAFEDSVRLMGAVGRTHKLKGEKIIPDDLDDGSTYYLGSRKSAVRLRCYEKGKELFKRTGDPAWRELFDWTRMELQVRPAKDFKATAARMVPEAFWGCAQWTRDIAIGVLDMSPKAVTVKPTRIADHDRAWRHCMMQYGPTFLEHVRRLGSWEEMMYDMQRCLGVDPGRGKGRE